MCIRDRILEPAEGAKEFNLTAPVAIGLRLTFKRNGRVVGERVNSIALQPGERGKTLFFFDVPDDLPHRADLTVQATVAGAEALPAGTALRLQLRRKLDFAPLPLWR